MTNIKTTPSPEGVVFSYIDFKKGFKRSYLHNYIYANKKTPHNYEVLKYINSQRTKVRHYQLAMQ